MSEDWVLIFETNKDFEAELIKGMLKEHDIEVFVMNKQDSLYLIGNFELYVTRDDVMRAKTLILNYNA
ncbi:MAG TPA: DUF2007 domain-containing protein [Bacteroidales bacterium]|nr:DUF2007 domain-containing protein [Bacteroidales bacterium]